MAPPSKDLEYICPSIEETDLPLICPANVHRCGPIVLQSASVDSADPELNRWLNNGDTVFVCLGSHFEYTESDVQGILGGLLKGLTPSVQVLWKLSGAGTWQTLLQQRLSGVPQRERFRIVDWIGPDPSAVLQHPNVKCSVHHGGANSFFEACQ